MTFDLTGLGVFLLAIIPGFIAQQSRYTIVPRSVKPKSNLEETGEYLLNSLLVHLFFLTSFGLFLSRTRSPALPSLIHALSHGLAGSWLLDHRYLALSYFLLTLLGGVALGFFRAILAINQPVRNLLIKLAPRALEALHVHSFLLEDPVWYGVLRQRARGEVTFVEVRLKGNAGYFAGELSSYGIVDDSKRQKDFYITNAWFREAGQNPDAYQKVCADGVMLNFSDADWLQIRKTVRPATVAGVSSAPGAQGDGHNPVAPAQTSA